jgi:hypothetical protein
MTKLPGKDSFPTREADLYAPLVRLFRRHKFIFGEVPFFGKRVDLVFATPSFLRLQAVETKLRDWRTAFKQAALNQLAVQHSYVALPAALAARLARQEERLFTAYDVGLISVNDEATILIPAMRNGYFNARHHRAVKRALVSAVCKQKPQKIGVFANALTERSRSLVLLQAWAD